MTTQAQIQEKIYRGYGKAAVRLGADFEIYRAFTPFNPISPINLIGSIKASFTPSWSYIPFNAYGNASWIGVVDGNIVRKFDYLKNGDQLFFISDMTPILSIQAIQCNRTISVTRPASSPDLDTDDYEGSIATGNSADPSLDPYINQMVDAPIAQGMPCSILLKTRLMKSQADLPTSVELGIWEMLMPEIGGAPLLISGDKVQDDDGQNFVVSIDEHTDKGLRVHLKEVGA